MPIVSINLSPKAYWIYDRLSKGRRASRIVSTLLINWDEEITQTVQLGDKRIMSDDREATWTEEGWKVIE
jgi:hypothetical protein